MDYSALKVADLKGLLKERGIPSTGLSRKQQIIEALVSHDANEGGEAAAAGDEDNEESKEDVDMKDAQEETTAEVEPEGKTPEDAADDQAAAQSGDSNGAEQGSGDGAAEPADITLEPEVAASQATSTEAPAPSTTAPTVLESNHPVSKEPSALATPQQTSPTRESQSSDRKRKRRSPTPPISEEAVNKKLKAAEEEIVTLPEDRSHEQGVGSAGTQAPSVGVEPTPHHGDELPQSQEPQVQPSIHQATRAIYIHNLVRPIQHPQLREHLLTLATPPGGNISDETLESLHIGSIRTHAFAVFDSISAASRARSGLHDRIWPDEPARKSLWVDFVPEEKVPEWIEAEGGAGRRDTRRWQVLYDETDDGVVARHEEVLPGGAVPETMPERRPSDMSTGGRGQGMPNAPLGPRGSRPSIPAVPPPKQSTPNPTSSASFVVLDEKFPSTSAKPKLYYLPVSKDLAERRIDELERQTSREWGARGGEMAGRGEVRRFTFEDGDKLVDGGPHFSDFSGPRGGGRGRGGGFRGRR